MALWTMWMGASPGSPRASPFVGGRGQVAARRWGAGGIFRAEMSLTVQAGTTLPFDRFWRWLKNHANCIQRAGTVDTFLYDQEPYHWHLEEDADRNPVVQLVWGKLLVGEMVLDVRDVLYVEATPEPEGSEPGQFLFELIGGAKEEPYPVYHFLLGHGFEDEGRAGGLKH